MADAKTQPADPKETSVAVKGLAPNATEATLSTLFIAHGKLLRIKLDKLGGAHVVFGSTRAAQRAAIAANGAIVDGKPITAQHVRAFAKTTRPCRSFQEGKCRKGDQCKYWHPTDGSSGTGTAAHVASVPTIVAAKKNKTVVATTSVAPVASGDDISVIPKSSICRNFAKGNCMQGASCRFAHVLGAGPLPPPTPASIPAQCSFFLAGRCTKGDDCAFLHTDRPPQAPASKMSMCSFFAAGRCARGDQCAYTHEATPDQATPTAAAVAPVASKPVVVAKPVVAKTAKVVKATKTVAVAAAPVAAAVKPVATKKTTKKETAPPPQQPQADDDRTCIECEKPDVATWLCDGCGDNAKYCDECKPMVHRPKVMRAHTQTPLPPVAPKTPVCGECEQSHAAVQCEECDVPYCAACDVAVHQFKSLRNHTRTPLTPTAPAVVTTKTKTTKTTKPAEPVNTKPTTTVVAAPVAVVKAPAAYVDSVPQFDLPSGSESSDDEEEEDDEDDNRVKPNAIVQTLQPESSSESEEEDDESDDEDQPAAAALAGLSYVESVPQFDLPSESESEEEEEEKAQVKPAVVHAAATAVSSESSDSDDSDDDSFEDERPVVSTPAVAPAQAPVAPVKVKVKAKTAVVTEISSESESDSDDEEEDKKPRVAVPKRKAASSDSDSSSGDDDDERAPAAKQPRVAAPAPVTRTPTPAPRPAAPTNQKPGISTGSSHSLVKKIEAYAASDDLYMLHLDPNLNGFERLLAHDCAERLGLHHISMGEGLERHITVSRKPSYAAAAKRPAATTAAPGAKKAKRS